MIEHAIYCVCQNCGNQWGRFKVKIKNPFLGRCDICYVYGEVAELELFGGLNDNNNNKR